MPDEQDEHRELDRLEECEAVLQYRFRDRTGLELALTHASISRTRIESNERLEFLGDSILGMVVCELLYQRYPDKLEGELTRIKSSLVSRGTCAALATKIGLEQFLMLGKGLLTRHRIPSSILAGVFESIVGAVYLDGGLAAVKPLIERVIARELEEESEPELSKNYKSILQQLAQKMRGETPMYRVLDEKGPDHSKCFKISASIGPQAFPSAWGSSKKEAEQRAALNALCELEGKAVPYLAE